MSAETFIKDYKAYFVDQELSEYDEQRIKQMFQQHSGGVITKIMYKYKVVTAGELRREEIRNVLANSKQVIKDICKHWGVPYEDVCAEGRKKNPVYVRFHAFRYFRDCGLTYKQIGDLFNRNHATVMMGINTADNLISTRHEPFYTMYTTWCQEKGMSHLRGEEASDFVLSQEEENEVPDFVNTTV